MKNLKITSELEDKINDFAEELMLAVIDKDRSLTPNEREALMELREVCGQIDRIVRANDQYKKLRNMLVK